MAPASRSRGGRIAGGGQGGYAEPVGFARHRLPRPVRQPPVQHQTVQTTGEQQGACSFAGVSEGHIAVFFQSGRRHVAGRTIASDDEDGLTASHTATRT